MHKLRSLSACPVELKCDNIHMSVMPKTLLSCATKSLHLRCLFSKSLSPEGGNTLPHPSTPTSYSTLCASFTAPIVSLNPGSAPEIREKS